MQTGEQNIKKSYNNKYIAIGDLLLMLSSAEFAAFFSQAGQCLLFPTRWHCSRVNRTAWKYSSVTQLWKWLYWALMILIWIWKRNMNSLSKSGNDARRLQLQYSLTGEYGPLQSQTVRLFILCKTIGIVCPSYLQWKRSTCCYWIIRHIIGTKKRQFLRKLCGSHMIIKYLDR